jgi:hypothetical protein
MGHKLVTLKKMENKDTLKTLIKFRISEEQRQFAIDESKKEGLDGNISAFLRYLLNRYRFSKYGHSERKRR